MFPRKYLWYSTALAKHLATLLYVLKPSYPPQPGLCDGRYYSVMAV